jgi:putative peptide zinc metalloprotease protein
VLQDHSTGKFFRFSPEAYVVIGLMNGKSTVNEIWEKACEKLGNNMPTQDEVIQLLSRLHVANVLQSNLTPDIDELFNRFKEEKRKRILQKIKSPLSIRVPLVDPDKFISRTAGIAKIIYSIPAAIVWLIFVASAMMLAGLHWVELTQNVADRILNVQNLFIAALLYPLIKLLHELGHAYAAKRWGGEVHEIGIMFLVFMPVPYVDASCASAFRVKWKRMLVASAGILTEIFIAACAMIAWSYMEPGFARSMAYNTMLIAGISTVFFNGNPLLRFDAYYVLSDFLEIPNLGNRSNNHIAYLFKKYLFKLKDIEPVANTQGESFWFVVYAITSFIYRMFIMFFIVIFVASKFFIFGVILAIWALYTSIFAPVIKIIKYLLKDNKLRRKRARVLATVSALIFIVVVPVVAFPVPLFTVTEGIVWAADDSQVRIGANGFISRIIARPGSQVKKGDLLLVSEDPEVSSRVKILRAQLEEYKLKKQASIKDITEYHILEDEIERVEAELDRILEKQQNLTVRSHRDGIFILMMGEDILGQYAKRGAAVGYVIKAGDLSIRAVVRQEDIDLVRLNTNAVSVRFSENLFEPAPAYIYREVPAASNQLPSPALSVEGGGTIPLDPQGKESLTSYETLFQFELKMKNMINDNIGQRVHVRFAHDYQPIISRVYRSLRQLFLNQFDI